jgi:hypothetical protein
MQGVQLYWVLLKDFQKENLRKHKPTTEVLQSQQRKVSPVLLFVSQIKNLKLT